jgi:hypothetical protein
MLNAALACRVLDRHGMLMSSSWNLSSFGHFAKGGAHMATKLELTLVGTLSAPSIA